MNICILSPRFPFPENGGDVLRINSIARYLKSQNHTLSLVSFCEGELKFKKEWFDLYDTIFVVPHSKICAAFFSFVFLIRGKPIQCGYYHSYKFSHMLNSVSRTENVDEYIAHLLRTAPYLEKKSFRKKSIIEMTDILSKTYSLSKKGNGSLFKKMIYKIERNLIARYENKVARIFPKVVLVSESDIEYFAKENDGKRFNLICYTNGVDQIQKINENYDEKKICFIGNMRTLQNQDAVLFFAKEIFPLVKWKIPDAIFKIIGAEPSQLIKNLHDEKNIFVTGFVDNLEKEISECCVAVAPVRIAAGIQNKVLVAMGCGIPVVMTSLISKAIPELADGKNCLIRDSAESMAETCIQLMQDARFRSRVSLAGYETVKECYSWNERLEGYEGILVE